MKKVLTVAAAVAGIVWAITRRGSKPADTWAQATDPV